MNILLFLRAVSQRAGRIDEPAVVLTLTITLR